MNKATENMLSEHQQQVRAAREANDAAVRRQSMLNRKTDSTRAVLQQTDRIITGRGTLEIKMVWPPVELDHNPAWTDGETVYLNRKMAEKMLEDPNLDMRDFVLVYKGTNYHEVAHILFSPRAGDGILSLIHQEIVKSGNIVWQAYMMLEDQRIETLYTSLYSPTSVYFVASCLKWLVSDTSMLADAYPLVYGRKFLPIEVRMTCRAAFVAIHGEKLASRFEKVIDSYLVVLFPKDEAKAFLLIKQFAQLLDLMGAGGRPIPRTKCQDGTTATGGPRPTSGNSNDVIRKGRAYQRDQKDAVEAAKDVIEQDKEDIKDWQDAQAEGDEADPLDGEGEGDDGEGEGGTAKSGGDKSSDGQGNAPQEGGEGGVGAGEGRVGAMDTNAAGEGIGYDPQDLLDILNDVSEAAKEALNDVMDDKSLQQDVGDTVKSIKAASDNGADVSGKYGRCKVVAAPSSVMAASRRIQKAMVDLKSDLEPSWLRQQMTGRLNEKRILRRRADPGILDVFDMWDEGAEEEASVEVVILVDLSGSMGTVVGQVSEVLWALKRAYDKTDIRTSAIGFSDGHVVLYKASDKASANEVSYFDVHGGTNPESALKEAHSILSRSVATNKLLVAITDGVWSGDRDQYQSIIRTLRKGGVVTMILGMGSFDPKGNTTYYGQVMPDFDITTKARTADDVASAIKSVVKEFIKRIR